MQNQNNNIVVIAILALGMILRTFAWFAQGVIDILLQMCDLRQGYPAEGFTGLGKGFKVVLDKTKDLKPKSLNGN